MNIERSLHGYQCAISDSDCQARKRDAVVRRQGRWRFCFSKGLLHTDYGTVEFGKPSKGLRDAKIKLIDNEHARVRPGPFESSDTNDQSVSKKAHVEGSQFSGQQHRRIQP